MGLIRCEKKEEEVRGTMNLAAEEGEIKNADVQRHPTWTEGAGDGETWCLSPRLCVSVRKDSLRPAFVTQTPVALKPYQFPLIGIRPAANHEDNTQTTLPHHMANK